MKKRPPIYGENDTTSAKPESIASRANPIAKIVAVFRHVIFESQWDLRSRMEEQPQEFQKEAGDTKTAVTMSLCQKKTHETEKIMCSIDIRFVITKPEALLQWIKSKSFAKNSGM